MANNQLDISILTSADFRDISPGLDALIEAFENNQYAHAYLISGDKGSGQLALCRLLIETLLGTKEETVDFLHISMSSVNERLATKNVSSIGVAAVKQMIVPFISATSLLQKPRVVLIEQAELLTEQAQNALLKSLEEPAAQVVFFLITGDMSKIIATVKSRCTKIYVNRWKKNKMETFLKQYTSDYESVAARSAGLIETAIEIVNRADEADVLDDVLQQLLSVKTVKDIIRFAAANVKMDSQTQDSLLNRYEDILEQAMQKSGGCDAEQYYRFPEHWQKAIDEHRTESFLRLIGHVMHARRMKNNQISWQACLDYMLADILEEMYKWQSL